MNSAAVTAAPWIEGLARLGYIAKGVVYTIVGGFAAGTAFGAGGTRGDSGSALQFIAEQPFGQLLTFVVAAGLFGYASWRIISALTDAERRGSEAKGIAIRSGGFFRGAIYLSLAFETARLALGRSGGGGSSDQSAQHWVTRLIDEPFGRWVIVAAGASVAAYGIYQMYRAWKAKLGKQLRLGWTTDRLRRRLVAISRFGIAARAVVFLLIGFSIARAAWERDPGEAQGTGGALRQVAGLSHWLLAVIAVGLLAYGVYQFVNARYRSIEAT